MKDKIVYIITVILSIIYIVVGNKIASENLTIFDQTAQQNVKKAVVTKIVDKVNTAEDIQIEGLETFENWSITFEAEITNGDEKGQIVSAYQNINSMMPSDLKEVEVGDKVIILEETLDDAIAEWTLLEYNRSDALVVLGIIFLIIILIFGRIKGFNTILSLVFTVLSIFIVFIPAILSGKNIYIWSIITCVFITVMTLLIVNGANKKSLAAGIGCLGGVIVAGILTVIMDNIIKLTGYVDENSVYLVYLNEENPIDLKAIIFSSIIIGAIGAIMDVAVDISVALKEIADKVKDSSFHSIVKSGFTIGRDILGTMSTTLILAYIGSSLSVVLLLVAYNSSLTYLFNREMIVVEILQALVGSLGILFTIPLTSIICGILYTRNKD